MCIRDRFYGDVPPDPSLPSFDLKTWPAWRDISDRVQPVTVPQLLDGFLAADAAAWGAQNCGVVWYESRAFGRWIADVSGLELCDGGQHAEEQIARLVSRGEKRSIIASIKSHGRGRNGLQY